MSLPAIRVGDQSVHGGAIIPPGAAPQKVLIKNMPAARVGDFHTCPMVTPLPGPVPPLPHVGGPIVVGIPTVLLGGMPAARTTSSALCITPAGPAPIDAIAPPAAGTPPSVLIGLGGAAGPVTYSIVGNPALWFKLFPGKQHYENCALQSINQVIEASTGQKHTENEMRKIGKKHGYTDNGGTNPKKMPAIANEASGGNVQLQNGGPGSSANAANALEQGKGVTAGTDAGKLWNDARFDGGGHRIVVSGAVKDPAGNVVGVIVNDTGTGAAGQAMSAAQFDAASAGRPLMVTVANIL